MNETHFALFKKYPFEQDRRDPRPLGLSTLYVCTSVPMF